MQNNEELELYLRKIRAGFGKRLVVTVFDLFYLLCMLFPVFIYVTLNRNQGLIDNFHQIVEKSHKLPAKKCFLFSLIVIAVLYIYFVYIPSTSDYQTFFGNSFAIKAIDISNGFDVNARPSQGQLFKLNVIPIFLLPLMNAVFFGIAWAKGDDDEWYSKIFKKENFAKLLDPKMDYKDQYESSIRVLASGMFFLQMFYLFTVAATKKALNWFTKSTGIIYVDLDRLAVLEERDKTFVKPTFEFPGATIEYENLNSESKENEEITEEEIPVEVTVNE